MEGEEFALASAIQLIIYSEVYFKYFRYLLNI